MSGTDFATFATAAALAVCAALAAILGSSPNVLIVAAAGITVILAVLAIRGRSALLADQASRNAIAEDTARSMARVWLWGTFSLLFTYLFIQQPWREWWHFTLGFAIAGAACVFFASLHQRDGATGREDETMLKLGRTLAIVQLVGTLATMVGLVVDPNKTFLDTKDPAWAANIIFFAGAAALAAISGYAVVTDRTSKA